MADEQDIGIQKGFWCVSSVALAQLCQRVNFELEKAVLLLIFFFPAEVTVLKTIAKVACAAREAVPAVTSLQTVSSEYCYNCLQSTIPHLSDAKFSDALNFPRVFLVFIMHLRAVRYSWLLSFLSGCISGEARCSMCGEKTDRQFTLATLFCNF